MRLKKQMWTAVSEMESALLEIRSSLSPLQVARFITWVEKIKCEDELLLADIWGVRKTSFPCSCEEEGQAHLG